MPKAPEVAINPEQVAPKVVEVVAPPVPVAPIKKKNPPKVVEADKTARSLRARLQRVGPFRTFLEI